MVTELFAENIDLFIPGIPRLPWTGKRSHRSEVAPYFQSMWPTFRPGKTRANAHKLLINGNDAVALGQLTYVVKATSKRFTLAVAMHLTIENGRISRLHFYEDMLAEAEASAIGLG